jgi:hypothetical protein
VILEAIARSISRQAPRIDGRRGKASPRVALGIADLADRVISKAVDRAPDDISTHGDLEYSSRHSFSAQ